MSLAKKKILSLLAEGKLTVEESEELLSAIEQETITNSAQNENTSSKKEETTNKENTTEEPEQHSRSTNRENEEKRRSGIFSDTGKFGFDLKNLAQTVQNTVEQAITKAEPKSRELKVKMKELGVWMHEVIGTIADDIGNFKGELKNATPVDFCINEPANSNSCSTFIFENTFGAIRINQGEKFKILVTGRVSKETLGEYQGHQWFTNNAIKIKNDVVFIGFDKSKSTKAIIDMEITLPADKIISCKTISSDIRIKGPFKIDEAKTVSGRINIQGAKLIDSVVESVSGNIQIEGGEISLQLKSTSGDFLVRNADIKTLKINSVSGDILITEGSIFENTEAVLATTSGDIIVEKLSGPWASIEAISRTGETELNWEGDATPLNNQGVQLKSGATGAIFTAESVSGDIQFLKDRNTN